MDFNPSSLQECTSAIRAKRISPSELGNYYLERIAEKNTSICAYIEVFDNVGEQIKDVEKRIGKGEDLALPGIPVAIKDNILIEGRVSSGGSKILDGYRAPYDATVITRLKKAGAIFLGRTNMDEFAMGSSTENSAFFKTKNPHDETRVPGGSSGGSAAAVGGGLAPIALGSDTGGSIRQPASFCGVVGLKPSYGAVSRYGLMALASSLDQIGPFGKSVEDVEILFNVIKGRDEKDATSVDFKEKATEKDTKKLAYPKDFIEKGLEKDVYENFLATIKRLERAGYVVEGVSMPELAYALPTYYIIMPAEASANLARYDGVRYGFSKKGRDGVDGYFKTRGEGFGKEVRRRILLGTYVLSAGYYDAYYKKALAVRALLKSALAKIFTSYDGIITPTSPILPFKFGERASDPLQMYVADIFTVSANLAGIPAISIPSGAVSKDGKNLPCGLQIMAPRGDEDVLFSVGKRFEAVL